MVGYVGSPTYTAYVDVTLTRSKVKVTGVLLNFRQLAKPCMLAAMTAAPLRGFLVDSYVGCHRRFHKIELLWDCQSRVFLKFLFVFFSGCMHSVTVLYRSLWLFWRLIYN